MIKKQTSTKTKRREKKQKRARVNPEGITSTVAKLDRLKRSNPKLAELVDLFKTWLTDESGYDEETWPELKQALNRERDGVGPRDCFFD